jgi:hypothetical protein
LRCEAHSLRRRRHVIQDLEKRSMRARQRAYSGVRSTNLWTDVYGITSIEGVARVDRVCAQEKTAIDAGGCTSKGSRIGP